MKRILIGITLSLVCILAFSQERVNTEKYIQFDKTTKALKKVIGYEGTGGEWESEKNRISHGMLGDTQKFEKLTVKTVTYNDTLYYVFIRNSNTSAPSDYVVQVGDVYKYVAGGGSYNKDLLYFFTASEFEQIFHLDKNTKTIYSFKVYSRPTGRFGRSDLSKISDAIIRVPDKNQKKDFINIRIADDGKMVRFLLPYQKNKYWNKDDDLFPLCYFEMPLKDFQKWLKPVSPLEK